MTVAAVIAKERRKRFQTALVGQRECGIGSLFEFDSGALGHIGARGFLSVPATASYGLALRSCRQNSPTVCLLAGGYS